MEIDDVGGWLRERLPGLAEEHGVPGVAVAVDAGGRVVEAATGVLSTATGVEATVDSVFQIGSVTKVLTATLVMGLVAEGLVELDAPVGRYLPGFRDATVRQLLCHTAGFEGDVFTDTGKGDDCLERYVELRTRRAIRTRRSCIAPRWGTSAGGHNGNTVGQSAVLRVDPGRDVSVAVFTNGGDRKPLMKEILGRVVESPAEPVPDAAARPDAGRCAGVYLSSTSQTTVSVDERGRLWLEQVPLGLAAEAGEEPYRTELLGWRRDSLLPAEPGRGPVAFLGDDGAGRARYLHTGRADVRAAGRIEA